MEETRPDEGVERKPPRCPVEIQTKSPEPAQKSLPGTALLRRQTRPHRLHQGTSPERNTQQGHQTLEKEVVEDAMIWGVLAQRSGQAQEVAQQRFQAIRNSVEEKRRRQALEKAGRALGALE